MCLFCIYWNALHLQWSRHCRLPTQHPCPLSSLLQSLRFEGLHLQFLQGPGNRRALALAMGKSWLLQSSSRFGAAIGLSAYPWDLNWFFVSSRKISAVNSSDGFSHSLCFLLSEFLWISVCITAFILRISAYLYSFLLFSRCILGDTLRLISQFSNLLFTSALMWLSLAIELFISGVIVAFP